ncbi:MAG: ATP-grasp domain-containing protein [Sciscionella sp.]
MIGAGFKPAARELGFVVVSLYTCDYSAQEPGHDEGDDVSLYAENADTAIRLLAECHLDIRAVIPGMEVGTHIADEIAHRLHLPGNDHTARMARRDKAAMRERARRAGLRIPEFHLVRSVGEIAAAARDIGFPVILKPTLGAGSQGVTLLPDADAVRDLGHLQTHDAFDEPVREWLVERYIRGRQLSVNTYSFDGEHRLVDMWEFVQPDDRDFDFPIWDNVQIDDGHHDWDRTAEFSRQALDVYGIERGPGHIEVKCAPDDVYLLEIASRLPGGPMVGAWLNHTRLRPYHDAIRCFLGRRPLMFDDPTGRTAWCGALAVHNETPGTLVAIHGLPELDGLPGIDEVLIDVHPGDEVPVTRDDLTIPLGVYVHAPTIDEVRQTLVTIRRLVSLEIKPR